MRLNEGNYRGDLQRLVQPELHIDEYRSKMGNDDDIIVLSFKVKGKEPAQDLVQFFETGYEFILDADVSPGEITPGWFLVFVELSRRTYTIPQIYQIVEETMNLTLQKLSEWVVTYGTAEDRGRRQRHKKYPFTKDMLELLIPTSPKKYRQLHPDEFQDSNEIAAMKNIAQIPVNQTAPDDIEMENIRVAAGIL